MSDDDLNDDFMQLNTITNATRLKKKNARLSGVSLKADGDKAHKIVSKTIEKKQKIVKTDTEKNVKEMSYCFQFLKISIVRLVVFFCCIDDTATQAVIAKVFGGTVGAVSQACACLVPLWSLHQSSLAAAVLWLLIRLPLHLGLHQRLAVQHPSFIHI